MPDLSDFEIQVLEAIRRVPKGRVTTYSEIARRIGRPGASRAVGNALNKNPYAPKIPCHRVVRSDGKVGGFARGTSIKKEMLEAEGIVIRNMRILHFNEKFIKL